MPADPADLDGTPVSEARLLASIEQVRASLATRSWWLSGLADALHALEGERDPTGVAATIAEQLGERGGCRHVGVLARDPGASEPTEVIAQSGETEDGEAWLELARSVVASGSDVAAGGARLGVPLLRPEGALGALVLTAGQGRPEGVDRKALYAFADAAALALANGFKFARIEDDARRLEHTEALLTEMHHRIKGNLQTVADLLSTQRQRETSPQARRALDAAVGRIKSMAAVHRLLARDLRGVTDSHDLIEGLMTTLKSGLGEDSGVHLTWHAEAVELPSRQASALGLIVHELVSNAVRHGGGGAGSELTVTLTASDGRALLTVGDQGPGLGPSFDLERDAGVGLRLVKVLAERGLSGTLALHNDSGLVATVAFDPKREGER